MLLKIMIDLLLQHIEGSVCFDSATTTYYLLNKRRLGHLLSGFRLIDQLAEVGRRGSLSRLARISDDLVVASLPTPQSA